MNSFNDDNLSAGRAERCSNCHEFIGEESYCKYCGMKKSGGEFKPEQNFMPCVYGSPEFMMMRKIVNNKKIFPAMLIALGVSVGVVILILILFNLL